MESFLKIVGLATLLMLCACSDRVAGGSWEDTNASTEEYPNNQPASSNSSAGTSSGAIKNSDAHVVAYSSSMNEDESVSPSSETSVNSSVVAKSSNSNDPEPAFDNDLPKGGVSSSSFAMSPGPAIGAVSSSATAMPSSSNSQNKGADTTSWVDPSPALDISVETINVGSQVWMKSLGAGGAALDWDSAMAPEACPNGFRLPTYGEADSLLHMNADGTFADRSEDGIGIITGGSKRVRALGWLPANNTGNGVVDGKFWTSEEYGETGAYYFAVSATEDDALLQGDLRTNVAYVRCIKK